MFDDFLFSAIFYNGKVIINGHGFDAGHFVISLINHRVLDDVEDNFSFYDKNEYVLRYMLLDGFIDTDTFLNTGIEYKKQIENLPLIEPFNLIDLNKDLSSIDSVFTRRNAEIINSYFKNCGDCSEKIKEFSNKDLSNDNSLRTGNKALLLLRRILNLSRLYITVRESIYLTYIAVKKLLDELSDIDNYDEAHILPVAIKYFGSNEFQCAEKYIMVDDGGVPTVAKEIRFTNFFHFIATDFYEGLKYGHYPRQCPICKKFFLMTSARNQIYCDGLYPEKIKGRQFTCRQVGAQLKRKEKSKDNPINVIYTNRCSNIRDDQCKGKITAEFAEKAKRLAKNRYERAVIHYEYAVNQYKNDMEKKKLYTDVETGYKI